MGDAPSEDREEFDAGSFVERWRAAEPVLRRRAARFRVHDGEVDDLLSEVAARMLARRLSPASIPDFVAVADHIAYRLVLGWNRTTRRRRLLDAKRVTYEDPLDREADDELDRLELRLAVEQALQGQPFASMSVTQRRAVFLLLRGGPFTGPERRAIHDAKGDPRWRRWFQGLLGGWVAAWERIRSRVPEPAQEASTLAAAAAAAAVVVVTFGGVVGLAQSGAAGAWDRPRPDPISLVVAPEPAPMAIAPSSVVTSPDRGGTAGDAAGGGPASKPPAAPLIEPSVTARLPGDDEGSGRVEAIVLRAGPMPAGTDLAVPFYCDSQMRQAVCRAVAAVPAPTG